MTVVGIVLILAGAAIVALSALAIALAMIAGDADRRIQRAREQACHGGERRRVEP